MIATTHASRRAQQRCIPPLVDQLLDQFGDEQYDGHGGVIRFFSRASIRTMQRQFGRAPSENCRNIWAHIRLKAVATVKSLQLVTEIRASEENETHVLSAVLCGNVKSKPS